MINIGQIDATSNLGYGEWVIQWMQCNDGCNRGSNQQTFWTGCVLWDIRRGDTISWFLQEWGSMIVIPVEVQSILELTVYYKNQLLMLEHNNNFTNSIRASINSSRFLWGSVKGDRFYQSRKRGFSCDWTNLDQAWDIIYANLGWFHQH